MSWVIMTSIIAYTPQSVRLSFIVSAPQGHQSDSKDLKHG